MTLHISNVEAESLSDLGKIIEAQATIVKEKDHEMKELISKIHSQKEEIKHYKKALKEHLKKHEKG